MRNLTTHLGTTLDLTYITLQTMYFLMYVSCPKLKKFIEQYAIVLLYLSSDTNNESLSKSSSKLCIYEKTMSIGRETVRL